MLKKRKPSNIDPRSLRHMMGVNQSQFWSPLGVTQSGGSRYEDGRGMPIPVQKLLRLKHVEGIDIDTISGEDWAVAEYLRHAKPDEFKMIVKAAVAWKNRKKAS